MPLAVDKSRNLPFGREIFGWRSAARSRREMRCATMDEHRDAETQRISGCLGVSSSLRSSFCKSLSAKAPDNVRWAIPAAVGAALMAQITMQIKHSHFSAMVLLLAGLIVAQVAAQEKFAPPASPRVTYDFNTDWRFFRSAKPDDDIAGFEAPEFDDSQWALVSTPHTFNDTDSFRQIISHSGGDRGMYKGLAFYRKHFKLPASAEPARFSSNSKGCARPGQIFLNGKELGRSENGVTAYGVEITRDAHFGDHENVLAVRIDNRANYSEKSTGTGFEWNANATYPNFGGINHRVWLHVTGKIYQTLPVYDGLQTLGVYVYPDNFSIADHTADITVHSQVQQRIRRSGDGFAGGVRRRSGGRHSRQVQRGATRHGAR